MGRPHLRTTPSRAGLHRKLRELHDRNDDLVTALGVANERIGTLVDRLNHCTELHRDANSALRTWPYRWAGNVARLLRLQPEMPKGYDQPIPATVEVKPSEGPV